MNIVKTLKNIRPDQPVWKTLLAVIPLGLLVVYWLYVLMLALFQDTLMMMGIICGIGWIVWAVSYLGESPDGEEEDSEETP